LAKLFDEARLCQVHRVLAEFGVHQDVEEDLKPFVHVLAQDRKGELGSPLAGPEVQAPAEEIDPVFNRGPVLRLRPALDERAAHELGQPGLVLRDIETAEIDEGRNVEQRQAVVLLDIGPQAVPQVGTERRRAGRLVLERRVLEIGRAGGLAQAQGNENKGDGQDRC
jgi:hypothetical protein